MPVTPPSSVRAQPVQLRRFPHPYRAMLALCSDLDETPDAAVYREQMRFLAQRLDTVGGCWMA